MPKPGRSSFMNIVLERGAAVQNAPPGVFRVVFIGGWGSGSSHSKEGAVAVIAIRPGTPFHEAEAKVRHTNGVNVVMCDGSVRVLDRLNEELASYQTAMRPILVGDPAFLRSTVINPIRARGATMTDSRFAAPPSRAAQAVIFTGADASHAIAPWQAKQIIAVLIG